MLSGAGTLFRKTANLRDSRLPSREPSQNGYDGILPSAYLNINCDGKNGPICRHYSHPATEVTAEVPSCAVTSMWHHI